MKFFDIFTCIDCDEYLLFGRRALYLMYGNK